MSKETFVLNAVRLLLNNPSASIEEMKPQDYGISYATAWRVLAKLREANLVLLSGEWSITQDGREWFCGSCNYRKRCLKIDKERHLQISRILTQRARHPV